MVVIPTSGRSATRKAEQPDPAIAIAKAKEEAERKAEEERRREEEKRRLAEEEKKRQEAEARLWRSYCCAFKYGNKGGGGQGSRYTDFDDVIITVTDEQIT